MTTTIVESRMVTATTSAVDARPERPLRPTGEAVAALLAAGIGMLALALVNQIAELSDPFAAWLHGIGKLWMPWAPGIGPYSGKETVSVLAWLVSWAILHPALRTRELSV